MSDESCNTHETARTRFVQAGDIRLHTAASAGVEGEGSPGCLSTISRLRATDRDLPVSMKSAGAQLDAIRKWGAVPSSDRYAMLGKNHQRSLIVHGSKDIVVIPINAFLLEQHLPDAQLVMYPDASHGAASQHADVFLEHAQIFLNP